jgi:nucleoid-associated protein YgaU
MKPHRRAMLQMLTAAPVAAGFSWSEAEAQQAHQKAHAAEAAAKKTAGPFKPKFFTRHEYATVTVLVDLVIPRDERSGSATDAGVPAFMDFMMVDQPARQTAIASASAATARPFSTRRPLSEPPSSTTSPGRTRPSRSSRTASRSSTASAISRRADSSRARWGSRICNTWATATRPNGLDVRTT